VEIAKEERNFTVSEFIRRGNAFAPEKPTVADPPSAATSKAAPEQNTEERTLVTPPPTESRPAAAATDRSATDAESAPLFLSNEADELRARWDSVQVGFVDEPRKAVEAADALVSSTMKRLAEAFADERQKLEQQWDRGGDVSTEEFRLALRRYRSFFTRLLAV
jgi:hypothetical protein